MHELPKDLTNSLRSFRGSIYGKQSTDKQDMDHDKACEPYGDTQFERALSETDSEHNANPAPPIHSTDYTHDRSSEQYYDLEKQDAALPHLHATAPPPNDQTPADPADPADPQSPDTHSEIYGPAVEDLDPAANRLSTNLTPLSKEDFCSLMGMRVPTSPQDSLDSLAIPYGLYDKIYRRWRSNNRQYKIFDLATYGLLLLQLAISAVFIILGALENLDTHITIAVLGAVATVLAGGLALMKGQGLPNRFRQTRDGLSNVLFEVEELYWDMRTGRPVLYKDVKKIREDYLRVLQQERAHHPDAWSGGQDGMGGGTGRGGTKKRTTSGT